MNITVNMSEAEAMLGLSGGNLNHWLKRTGYRTYKKGSERKANIAILDAYEASTNPLRIRRVDSVPIGYLSVARAIEDTGMSTDAIHRAIRSGKLDIVRKSGKFFIEPYSLEKFVFEFNQFPIPGWVAYAALAKAQGSCPNAFTKWFECYGYEIRTYRSRSTRKLSRHVLEEALEHLQRDYGANCVNHRKRRKEL